MSSKSNLKVYVIGSFAAIGGFLFGYQIAVISGVVTMPDFISKFVDAESKQKNKLSTIINGTGCVKMFF